MSNFEDDFLFPVDRGPFITEGFRPATDEEMAILKPLPTYTEAEVLELLKKCVNHCKYTFGHPMSDFGNTDNAATTFFEQNKKKICKTI